MKLWGYEIFRYLSEEEALREDIADLSTEITIKQKLVEELENSQKRLTLIKHQYEEKMSLLQTKIKETEDERDKVCNELLLIAEDRTLLYMPTDV